MHIGCVVPPRTGVRFAAQYADRDLDARKLLALKLDRVDARQQVQRRVRDEIRVQQVADARRVAACRIRIVIGDQGTKL